MPSETSVKTLCTMVVETFGTYMLVRTLSRTDAGIHSNAASRTVGGLFAVGTSRANLSPGYAAARLERKQRTPGERPQLVAMSYEIKKVAPGQ